MALAILDLVDGNEKDLVFRIDTGTNTRYELKIGNAVREEGGDEFVDGAYFTTPPESTSGNPAFGPPVELRLPRSKLRPGEAYAQLYTSKPGERGIAVSDVVPLASAEAYMPSRRAFGIGQSIGRPLVMTASPNFRVPRRVPNRSAPLARQTSIDDLLGAIAKLASPLVLDLLSKPGNGSAAGASAGTPMDLIAQVLKLLLVPAGQPAEMPAGPAKQASLELHNRWGPGGARVDARTFMFGIDDALLASLAGPLIQVLPQLMNAANQRRIETKKSDDQLMGGIVSELQKRLLMDKLIEAQQAVRAQGPAAPLSAEDLAALTALVSKMDAAPAATPAPTSQAAAPLAAAKSTGLSSATDKHAHSNKAMLAFRFRPDVEWNGTPKTVFDRSRTLTFDLQFVVAEPAPKQPLAKAIVKVVIRDAAHPAARVEKVLKLKNVLANAPISCSFDLGDLAQLPSDALCSVMAELRWPRPDAGAAGRALGAAEIVLVGKSFIKSPGPATSAERELTDMARYRPFWNKVWEAPVLDGARGAKRYSWELHVAARYTSVLSADHASNGIMETKLLTEADDPQSPVARIRGRMKAGIELSTAELNKLSLLWDGAPMLAQDDLDAFAARPFLDAAARRFEYLFELKGRAGQAGMVWVVPVFKLHAFTLSQIAGTADNGQVTATSERQVQFPLPVAARLIGLRSGS